MLLEHHTDVALLRGEAHPGLGVVHDRSADPDVAGIHRHEPGQGPQQRGLAGPVGSDHGDDLPRCRVQVHVEVEAAELQCHARLDRRGGGAGGVRSAWGACLVAHTAVRKRSRSATSTATEMASSTTLSR